MPPCTCGTAGVAVLAALDAQLATDPPFNSRENKKKPRGDAVQVLNTVVKCSANRAVPGVPSWCVGCWTSRVEEGLLLPYTLALERLTQVRQVHPVNPRKGTAT